MRRQYLVPVVVFLLAALAGSCTSSETAKRKYLASGDKYVALGK
jgi:hypothetical protein